jgi:acyl CoA:acetate/3-ketoacid CoA transferase beta subunit
VSAFTRAELCAVAVADAFRGDGEILASSFGTVPAVGARLAKATFEPELLMTDGVATLLEEPLPVSGGADVQAVPEAWLPFANVFDLLWNGKRHIVMVASQVDRFGNQNFACIGPHAKPRAQLLGMRGAPGNSICHKTSYWVSNHSKRVFVEEVDCVSGVGHDRAAALGEGGRFHEVHQVISNLGVFDFETPDRSMRLRSLHPGVRLDEVVENTGFELAVDGDVPETRSPAEEDLQLIREVIDPEGLAGREVKG